MSTAKLSKTQQELLDAMRAGVKVHYMPYAGNWNPKAYYFREDNMQRVTAPANGLIEKGYAKKTGDFRDKFLVLVQSSTNPNKEAPTP